MGEMVCPKCKKNQPTHTAEYHYLESGLTNVWLEGIEILQCDCGEEVVSLPRILDLHKLIADILLEQKNQLSGREIRFLRKHLGMKAIKFAAGLGVDNATISRWEHEKEKPSEVADRLIRLFYAAHLGLQEKAEKLAQDIFPEIRPEQTEIPIHVPMKNLKSRYPKICQ